MSSSSLDSRLAISFISNFNGVKSCFTSRFHDQLISQGTPAEKIEIETSKALEALQNDIHRIQTTLSRNALLKHIHPVMLCTSIDEFVYLFLKGRVEEYFLDQPEDLEFREKWRLFCLDSAQFHGGEKSLVFAKINNFLNEVYEKLKLYRMHDEKSAFELGMIDVLRELCSNPDLFCCNLGQFIGQKIDLPDGSIKVKVSVMDMQQAFYLLMQTIKENLGWLINDSEQKMEIYSDVLSLVRRDEAGETYREIILKLFSALKNLSSKIHLIKFNSVSDILNILPQLEKVNDLIQSAFSNETYVFSKKQTKTFGSSEKIIDALAKNFEDCQPTQEKVKAALRELEHVCFLFNHYVHCVWIHIMDTFYLLKDWSQKVRIFFRKGKSRETFKQFLGSIPRLIEATQFLQVKPTPLADFDETLVFVEGPSKSKKNSAKRAVTQTQSQKRPVSEAPLDISKKVKPIVETARHLAASSQSTSSLTTPSQSLFSTEPSSSMSREERILETLVQEVPKLSLTRTPYLKSSLRQVELAFSSLVAAYQKVHVTAAADFGSYHYHLMISRMYYLIEQLLRHKCIESGFTSNTFNHHILERLRDLRYHHPVADIARELSSANLWVSYTENQIDSRLLIDLLNEHQQKMKIPLILLNLYKISHAPNQELRLKLKNEIESLYRRALDFVEFCVAPEIRSTSISKPPRQISQIVLEETLNEATVRGYQCRLNTIINQVKKVLPTRAWNTLRQGNKSLSFLEQTLKHLSAPGLTLEEFSPLLRDAILQTNQVCETVFQVLFQKKHHIETYEHDVSRLMESSLDSLPPEDVEFFRANFKEIHTDARYPFDLNTIRSTFHRYVLKAEFLRERDELDEGFRISGKMQTHFNFTLLDNTEFTTGTIWNDVSKIISCALDIVFQKALPHVIS